MKLLTVLILMPALAASGQTRRPNFSGEWELVMAKSDFGKIPPPKNVTHLIEHRGTKIKFKSTMVLDAGEFSDELNYLTTGVETVNMSLGSKMTSKSRWEKQELVTDTVAENPQTRVEFQERWSLADGGKTFVNHRVIRTKQGDVVQKLIFEKKQKGSRI